MSQPIQSSLVTTNLADILERVLDKGIVIAGDIRISIADVELLTIEIRLLICSVERAKEIGITWWEDNSFLSPKAKTKNKKLKKPISTMDMLRKSAKKAV